MADSIQLHPLDFDGLNKGDRVSVSHCEAALGVLSSHPRYQLRLLALKQQIERELFARGKPATLRIEGREIVICDDPEASAYNVRAFRRGVRCSARAHARNMVVDAHQLDAPQRKAHERALLVQGTILASISQAKKQLRLKPTGRTTPTLPQAKGNGESER